MWLNIMADIAWELDNVTLLLRCYSTDFTFVQWPGYTQDVAMTERLPIEK